MADLPPRPLSGKISAALPYALPVAGGALGMAYTNMTAHGNPVLYVVIGVVGGRVLATVLNRLLQ